MEGLMVKLLWGHLACLRLLLCMSPQLGYVLPNEFFQSSEIMAGDIFGFSHYRTWEWNSTSPARTIIFPLISSGIPFLILKYVSAYWEFSISAFSLLLAPRLWMTLQSFLIDIMVYNIAKTMYQNENLANVASIIFASSYTTWVYCTRTFSNATELLLLALLIHTVTSSSKSRHGNSKINSNVQPTIISSVVVAGFFIRTSFVAFAAVPVLFWITQDFSKQKFILWVTKASIRLLALLPGAVFTFALFVFCDSIYFNGDKVFELSRKWKDVPVLEIVTWFKSLSLTPYNIIKYNLDTTNLQKHGLHPWYLHIVVNLPLLFGPLVLVLFRSLLQQSHIKERLNNVSINKNIYNLLVCTFACGLISLSMISHQEPRYILPLLLPIAVLSAQYLYPLSSHKFFISIWLVFNVFGYISFGLLHQGGIVPCMDYFNSLAKAYRHDDYLLSRTPTTVTVIFYKTYMPPVHLIGWNENISKNKLQVINLTGSSQKSLFEQIDSLLSKPNSETFLVMPASLPCDVYRKLDTYYKLSVFFQAFPHLSFEDPPWEDVGCRHADRDNKFLDMTSRTSLNLYKVELLDDTEFQNSAIYSFTQVNSSPE